MRNIEFDFRYAELEFLLKKSETGDFSISLSEIKRFLRNIKDRIEFLEHENEILKLARKEKE